MLQFKDPKKELPKTYKTVFIKRKYNGYDFAVFNGFNWHIDDDSLEVNFSLDDVIGWMPIEELDVIPIK